MTESVPRRAPTWLARRDVLKLAGVGAGAVLAGGPLLNRPLAAATRPTSPEFLRRANRSGAPPVEGLRLTFGDDPATQMVVSWTTHEPVNAPAVMLGTALGDLGQAVPASTRSYTDGRSRRQVHVHSARIDNLFPATDYVYRATHDGAAPQSGTIRTAPAGRAPFTFTSFGDMGSPKRTRGARGRWVNDACGSPHSYDVVDGVERIAPLFNLLNGDLCYANLSHDRLRTWSGFLENISRSARHRPWMPAAGNHENEGLNGPIGYTAFQTYFPVPNPGTAGGPFAGLWYAYTVGNVRFVHLQNDDVCLQDGGSSYIHGYSAGGQRAWLEAELRHSRAQPRIDWIVVCMHQVAMSTSRYNGADLGIRRNWLPLFDAHGVDLVVSGHEHHYERTHPVRGVESNDTMTPRAQAWDKRNVDSTRGTVHMIIGSGGTSNPSHRMLSHDRSCHVITGLTRERTDSGHRAPKYLVESGPWSAVRDADHPYGFAAFAVDNAPPAGTTTIDVTYYDVVGPGGQLAAFDTFRMTKPTGPASPALI